MLRKIFHSKNSQSTLGSILSAGFGTLTFALMARVIDKEPLGEWFFFISIFTLIDMARTGLLGNPFQKMYFDDDSDQHRDHVIGSTWKLTFAINGIIVLLGALVLGLSYAFQWDVPYLHFAWWIPLAALASQASNFGVWMLQAKQEYLHLIWVRGGVQFLFFLGICGVALDWFGVEDLIWLYAIGYFLPGLLVTFMGMNGLAKWVKGTWTKSKEIFAFGRYSFGTLLATNLLKSSDTFLIMPFLGPVAIAIYTVPERVLRIIDIPLQGFIAAYFPQLADARLIGGDEELSETMHRSMGFLFFLLLIPAALLWIFTPQLVLIFAGPDFEEAHGILRIFILYTLLIPFDRLNGMALDILNRPQRNLTKVIIMLSVNVIGDLIVLYLGGGLFEVACVTIATFTAGILSGFWFLRDYLTIRPQNILKLGWNVVVYNIKRKPNDSTKGK